MSGLLQRLAAQALGPQLERATSIIRPAMTTHAQVPWSMPKVDEATPGDSARAVLPKTSPIERHVTAPTHAVVTMPSVDRTAQSSGSQMSMSASVDPDAAPMQEKYDAKDRRPASMLLSRLLDKEPTDVSPASVAIAPTIVPTGFASAREYTVERSESTEVHVHIGRIEVMAIAEPAKAGNAPRPARQLTMPLADYLARGKRR